MRLVPWRFFFTSITADLPLEEIVDEVRDFDERFGLILNKHLALLGVWCFLNLLVGLPGLFYLEGWLWYFMLMNLTWAFINYFVVMWIFDHKYMRRFLKGNVFQRFETQRHVEKMLLFNIGLDTAYIFAGLWLKALAANPASQHAEMWLGFGWSVILQGAFLFIHDNVFHYLHLLNFRKCEPFLEDVMESQLALRKEELLK